MTTELERLAMGVFLPVTLSLTPEDHLLSFLDSGGRAILYGEEADEFRTGRLRLSRLAEETPEHVRSVLESLSSRSDGLLVACDADLAAVNRLQGVVGELPTCEDAIVMSDEDLFTILHDHAVKSRELGFTHFLSPTADLIVENRWLQGRTLGSEAQARRLVDLHVRAIQQSGMTAALKHFPGHPNLVGNPSTGTAVVFSDMNEIQAHLGAFRAGFEAGAGAVVLSSAYFKAFSSPANLAPEVLNMLRKGLGFDGLVITLDLDHPSCQGSMQLEEVCLQSLIAGADLLLLSPEGAKKIPQLAFFIAKAVETSVLSIERLTAAVAAVNRHVY